MVEVHSPLAELDLVAQAKAELPAALAALRAARASLGGADPAAARARRELALFEAELSAGSAFLLLPPRGAETRERCQRAQAAALVALADEALAERLRGAEDAGLAQALAELDAGARLEREALFWWAFARGAEMRANPGDVQLARDLPRTDAVMQWALERTPPDASAWRRAGPRLYFALRYTSLGRGLGGDPRRAEPHFLAARELAGPLARVLEARHFAPSLAATPRGSSIETVLAAQRAAYERFREQLLAALAPSAPAAGEDPARRLADEVARRRARELLADPSAAGLIPPDDAEPLELPPPSRAPEWVSSLPGRVLVRPDREQAGLLVLPEPGLDPSARAALVARIEAQLAEQRAQLGQLWLAGPEAITHDLDVASQQSFGLLFPLVAALMVGVLIAALRAPGAALAILVTAGATALWTIGLLGAAGRTLNLIVVVLPAVLVVITTAYALHLVSRAQTLAGEGAEPPLEPRALWARAARETLPPCALTALTTAAGFGSLAFSEIPPVRDLGIFAAAGALIACGLVFSLLPALLLNRPLRAPRASGWSQPRAEALTRALKRGAVPILLAAAVLAGVGVEGARRLRFESHVLQFFPADHRLPRAYAEVEERLLGLTPLELWLEGPRDELLTAQRLGDLRAFVAEARQDPLVGEVISPLGLDPRWDELSPAALAALLRAGLAEEARGVAESHLRLLEGGTLALRITLACQTTSSEAFDRLVRHLRGRIPASLREGPAPLRLSGAVPLLVRTQALLVDTQLRSFGLALLVVTAVLLLAYRSLGLVLISLLPNVLPILITLGAMGWFGVPLNTATVTVAGIALGLVVDDTIHLLHHHHLARRGGAPPGPAVRDTLWLVGRPVTVTTAAVALGFGAFAVSDFAPTFYFGSLIALTCLSAWVCDLLALPALLLVGRDPGFDSGVDAAPPPA